MYNKGCEINILGILIRTKNYLNYKYILYFSLNHYAFN